MPNQRAALRHLGAATLALLLAVAGVSQPAAAWDTSGNYYGTHDWILDQAFRLLDARGIDLSWVDRTAALLATDDPDTIEVAADPTRDIEHVYTGDGGRRGGAVDRISEHYATMLRAYAAHDYATASYNLGMLAHFYGDILQPFHTSRDAIGKSTIHHAYEDLVNTYTRTPTASPTWSVRNTSWVVQDVTNVRTMAIADAAYSRARYLKLAAAYSTTDTSLQPDAATVTREVLIRASGSLANIVESVPKGVGNPPPVASLTVSLRYRGVKTNEGSEYFYGTIKDVNGNPMEGVRVNVAWPMPDGSTKIMPFWTDTHGTGHVLGVVGSNPYMVHNTVVATVTTNLTTISKSTWWYRTKRLADGTAGFKTTVNDSTVHAGQVVTATSLAMTSTGEPIAGLLVNFTWTLGSTTVKTSAYTDATGKARSTFTVLSTTSRSTLYVKGSTTAYSINRSSTASFHRTD